MQPSDFERPKLLTEHDEKFIRVPLATRILFAGLLNELVIAYQIDDRFQICLRFRYLRETIKRLRSAGLLKSDILKVASFILNHDFTGEIEMLIERCFNYFTFPFITTPRIDYMIRNCFIVSTVHYFLLFE